ncbi:MAG: alpha-galactosidase [Lacunisphaera sp.]
MIDAGWFAPEKGEWGRGARRLIPSRKLFPNGIAATAAAIRERGLIPGLWFEMEVAGRNSEAFKSMTDHQLKRDGLPITANNRRFWDMRDPAAIDYLDRKVVGLLREANFGYVKVDYNETIGIGADGTESLGEPCASTWWECRDSFSICAKHCPTS